MNAPNLFFSVGEPSGDLHAAKLISQLRQLQPSATFQGFGGVRMREAGCHIDYELTGLAVMGFTEVLPKLREFYRVADIASDIFARKRPDAVVLVDFPGFNWHIAERAKQHNIPVIYYLPPQLWAWGGWRIAKMRRNVDHIICNLPFEPQWYARRRVPVDYVGHPFFDEVRERQLDERFLAQWRECEGVQVAVLPGSRTREVKKIWPMQLAAIRELARRHPQARFMVAALHDQHCLWCSQQLTDSDQGLNIEFFVGKTSEIIELADCSLMKSGSVSLEMMARGTPSVVVYHISRGHYAIALCVKRVKSMSLPNLIAGKVIMPEFLAVGATGKAIGQSIAALDRLMSDADERERQRQELLLLSLQVGGEAGEYERNAAEREGRCSAAGLQTHNAANSVSRRAALSIYRHLGIETEIPSPRCPPALMAG